MFTDLAAIRVYHVGKYATRAHATRRESSTDKGNARDLSVRRAAIPPTTPLRSPQANMHHACSSQPGESLAIACQLRQIRHPAVADGGFVVGGYRPYCP